MSTKPRAFITGVYGQDGSYLAEYLLEKGYEVLGLAHDKENDDSNAKSFITHNAFSVCVGDLGNLDSFKEALITFFPDEIYNIAAVSDLKTAKEKPEYTKEINFVAVKKLVEFGTQMNPHVRIFQALSSRILKADAQGVITEESQLDEPKNAYDEAKREAYEKVVLPYRKQGFFIASGFLCNHESPRRGSRFVTGKIAQTVARIAHQKEEALMVGNVDAKRDWSFAGDVVRGMHAALRADTPLDYVIGSGELHSVREFIEKAFEVIQKRITWKGEGKEVEGFDEDGVLRVKVEEAFYQTDDNPVVSSTTKLEETTGWRREITFPELVTMMVQAELKKIQK